MLKQKQQQFVNILAILSFRDIFILTMRYNLKLTYQEIARTLNISNERVRQLISKALKIIEREL